MRSANAFAERVDYLARDEFLESIEYLSPTRTKFQFLLAANSGVLLRLNLFTHVSYHIKSGYFPNVQAY